MELSKIIKAIASLREEDEQMPAQMAQCLLCVALRPGLTMQELGDMVGISQSSCSRNIAALGEWHRFGKPGLNLVEAVEDPRERRRKVAFLTPKGRQRIGKVLGAVTGEVINFEAPTAKSALRG